MIVSLLVAALASTTPPMEASPGPPAAAAKATVGIDDPVTLNLKNAELTNVLVNLATLLGVTPIVEPGVGGSISITVQAPIAEILHELERSSDLVIRVEGGRMLVSRRAKRPEPSIDDAAADDRFLADAALPRRPAAAVPRPFAGALELRTGVGTPVRVPAAAPVLVRVPGCTVDVAIYPVPGDRFDALPSFALVGAGDLPRVLSPTRTDDVPLDLAGCPSPVLARLTDTPAVPGAQAPVPSGQFVLRLSVVEVTPTGENVLSQPGIQTLGGEAASVQSGSTRRSPGGALLTQTTQAALVVVEASEKTATVALSASVVRDVAPKEGGAVAIRVAHARQSVRLTFGKSERIVLTPTYGRGDSALVLDVAVRRLPPKG